MAAVMIALPSRQHRHCLTLRDGLSPRFADAGASSQVAGTPRLTIPVRQGTEMGPPRRPSRSRFHTVPIPSNFAEISPQGQMSPQSQLCSQTQLFSQSQFSPRSQNAPQGYNSVKDMAFAASNLPDNSPKTADQKQVCRRTQRSKTLGGPTSHCSVSVVAPGGGTGINSSVYAALGQKKGFSVGILGQSRAPYDRYPLSFKDGAPAPNLESFALDLARQGCIEQCDCLVVGSRGGQVVLPTLWQALGEEVPPAIVMNGGCAMPSLPNPVPWPINAVTFLMLGGNDNFRGNLGLEEYLADAQQRVPQANSSTAILLVREMTHMPQAALLNAILEHMIRAVTLWQSLGRVPLREFQTILGSLRSGGWSGKLTYKMGAGTAWQAEAFP